MMTSSGLVDGSWELSVVVTNVQTTENVPTERTLRVKGDLHVGGVMLKLVEALGMNVSESSNPALCPFINVMLYSLVLNPA